MTSLLPFLYVNGIFSFHLDFLFAVENLVLWAFVDAEDKTNVENRLTLIRWKFFEGEKYKKSFFRV
jgi:hypothetical protein